MHPLNVFKNSKLPLKYPSNWIRMARAFRRSFKYAYQRVTKGAADCDYWDWDHTLLIQFVQGLDWLINNSHGWPGNEEFPEYEDWVAYLKKMKVLFMKADEDNNYYPTPYELKWWHGVEAGEEDPDDVKAMLDEGQRNWEKRQRDFQEAWDMMGKVFFHLWD